MCLQGKGALSRHDVRGEHSGACVCVSQGTTPQLARPARCQRNSDASARVCAVDECIVEDGDCSAGGTCCDGIACTDGICTDDPGLELPPCMEEGDDCGDTGCCEGLVCDAASVTCTVPVVEEECSMAGEACGTCCPGSGLECADGALPCRCFCMKLSALSIIDDSEGPVDIEAPIDRLHLPACSC